jgi:hypothetical protein
MLLWVPWTVCLYLASTAAWASPTASPTGSPRGSPRASPASSATEAPDTALLSRFPVGRLPDSAAVLAEMSRLAERGGPEHEPLLVSIAAHERGVVRARALRALDDIDARAREEVRADFRRRLPSAEAERRAAAANLRRDPSLAAFSEAERAAQAYASLLMGGSAPAAEAPSTGPIDGPCEERLVAEARQLERSGEVGGAVLRYAHAASAGDEGARSALTELGIDVQRLVLGLQVQSEAAAALDPAAAAPPAGLRCGAAPAFGPARGESDRAALDPVARGR